MLEKEEENFNKLKSNKDYIVPDDMKDKGFMTSIKEAQVERHVENEKNQTALFKAFYDVIINIIDSCIFKLLLYIVFTVGIFLLLFLVILSIFGEVKGYSEGTTNLFGVYTMDRQNARDLLLYGLFYFFPNLSNFTKCKN